MSGFITKEGLAELDNYKYKPGGYTWLDNQMNHFWNWTVELVPQWVAPNLLTFIGWVFVIASYVCMLIYDYTFTQNIPTWCFAFAAVCIFLYSTLDAIDGKQARRTKSSSPLGQLFDHGCDSFSLSFFMLAICQATKLEKEEVFFIFLSTQTTFWVSNWMEYKTGILKTKVGQFGVTEGEFTCMFIHILTAIFGQDMWSIRVGAMLPKILLSPLLEMWPNSNLEEVKVGSIVIYFYGYLLFGLCIFSIVRTLLQEKQKLEMVGEYLTFGLMVGMELIWMGLWIYEKYVGIILVNFGILASLFICKLIICSVTKMKFQYFHPQLIPFLIFTPLLVYFNTKDNMNVMIGLFWMCFGINLFLILRFLYLSINQLTTHLKIYCFSLKKVKDQ